MRFGIAFQLVLAIGAVSGFVSNQPTSYLVRNSCDASRTNLRSSIGNGWDNENFLDSLSGGTDAMDAANQKYLQQSEQRGKLQEWRQQQQARSMKEQTATPSTLHAEDSPGGEADAEEEEGQGGSRFKELMKKSQQAKAAGPSQALEGGPILYNPMEGLTPPSKEEAPDAASETDLTMEEQAQLFQKFMKMQQGGGESAPAPSGQRPDGSGKRVGRNRDADTIANTADVYFAQLKRDSTVRTIARYQGDEEKANAVFEDEGVKELENMITKNPYLKDAAKNSALLDTSEDEMVAVMRLTAGHPEEKVKSSTGPSYKQKLAEKKRKKRGGASTPESPKTQGVVQETMETLAAAQPEPAVAKVAPPTATQQEPVAAGAPEQTSVMAPPPDAPAVPSTETGDKPEVRRGIRTLMGLLLKHRGGPGFGKGRIKGAEAEGFENLLGEITEMLHAEAADTDGVAASTEVKTAHAAQSTPPPPIQPQAVAPPPPVEKVEPPMQQRVVSPPPPQQQMPPPQQPQVPYTPPATTMMGSTAMTYKAPGLPDDRMTRTIACVEGAVQMYRNSPPEVQEGLMVPLRGALMSAVNTCNQIIAENELQNVQSYQDAVTESPIPDARVENSGPMTPGQFFEVKPYMPGGATQESGEEESLSMAEETMAPPEPEVTSSPDAVSTPTGTDENSLFLQTVYDSLEESKGNEMFGLGKLSSEQAASLADKVVEMKGMLIEELEAGIPESTNNQANTSTAGGSKYQQMLAKAKAEKEAK